MQALIFENHGRTSLTPCELVPRPGEVLVRVVVCGFRDSDVKGYGRKPREEIVPGAVPPGGPRVQRRGEGLASGVGAVRRLRRMPNRLPLPLSKGLAHRARSPGEVCLPSCRTHQPVVPTCRRHGGETGPSPSLWRSPCTSWRYLTLLGRKVLALGQGTTGSLGRR